MRGAVQFFAGKNIVTPACVAFAGAEFIVKGSATVEKIKYWHVVVEVRILASPSHIFTETPYIVDSLHHEKV